MELKVIRHQNNEMTTTSYYLKKEQELLIARVYIDNEVSRRLSDVVSDKQPFTILCENGYSGFVSEHVQVVRTTPAKPRHSHSQPDNPQGRLPNIG